MLCLYIRESILCRRCRSRRRCCAFTAAFAHRNEQVLRYIYDMSETGETDRKHERRKEKTKQKSLDSPHVCMRTVCVCVCAFAVFFFFSPIRRRCRRCLFVSSINLAN